MRHLHCTFLLKEYVDKKCTFTWDTCIRFVLIKEIMQRRRACTFFHWEYPKEVDSCQKSNGISPQRIAFFNASENLRWFGELFAQTQSLSSLVLKNVSLKNVSYIFFNLQYQGRHYVKYFNAKKHFSIPHCKCSYS